MERTPEALHKKADTLSLEKIIIQLRKKKKGKNWLHGNINFKDGQLIGEAKQKVKSTKLLSLTKMSTRLDEIDTDYLQEHFEVDVMQFMKDIGFVNMHGTENHGETFYLDRRVGKKVLKKDIQIDAMGLVPQSVNHGKHLFVVNAKITKNEKGQYGGSATALRKAIKDHAVDRDSQLKKLAKEIEAVKDGNPTSTWNKAKLQRYADIGDDLQLHPVIALKKGVQPSPSDKKLLYDQQKNSTSKIFCWDFSFMDYYGNLAKVIGEYAMFDMLGELNFEDEEEDVQIAFCQQAITKTLDFNEKKNRWIERKIKTYQFVMDPVKLLRIATVARRHRPGEQFYQRSIDGGRLEAIADDLEKGKSIPNNIIVGMDKATARVANFVPFKEEYKRKQNVDQQDLLTDLKKDIAQSSVPVKLGTLTFPRKYRSCWVIDGQHRLYGTIKKSSKDKKQQPILKREVKMSIVVYAGVALQTMASMFLDINDKQVAIPTPLKYDLYAEFLKEESEGVASRLCKRLNNGNSALHHRISFPSYQQWEKEYPDQLSEDKRIPIQAMWDAVRHKKIYDRVLFTEKTGKRPKDTPNPILKGITGPDGSAKYNAKVIERAAGLIEEWYTALVAEHPGYGNKPYTIKIGRRKTQAPAPDSPHEGMLLAPQVCKIWLDLLAEIVIHEDNIMWHKSGANKTKTLKKYARAVKPYIAQCMANPEVLSLRKKHASSYGTAKLELQDLARTIKSNSKRADRVPDFGEKSGLLSSEDPRWKKLERKFGRYIKAHVKKWKTRLSPERRNIVARDARRANKSKSEHLFLEMQDVEKILISPPARFNQTQSLSALATKFRNATNFQRESQREMEHNLRHRIQEIAREFTNTRDFEKPSDPGPHNSNATDIKEYMVALNQMQ